MGLEKLDKKKSVLSFEEKILAGLFIVIPLFLIILFDNLKSTGFAVALSPQANFSIGLCLWIVVIILVGAWGYLRMRKFMRARRFK